MAKEIPLNSTVKQIRIASAKTDLLLLIYKTKNYVHKHFRNQNHLKSIIKDINDFSVI
jgi:hypothetical protein